MGALRDLVEGSTPSASPQTQTKPSLTPKVQSAQGALATQTAKVKANFKAQAAKPGVGSGNIRALMQKAEAIQKTGSPDDGFHFSWNPLETIGSIAKNVPVVNALLQTIDTPRAYVASAVNQTANALDFSDNKGFDLGELNSDALEHKGIGQYFQEQLVRNAAEHGGKAQLFGLKVDPNSDSPVSEWGKRALGLTGDIATDPLSYVSGGVTDATGEVSKALSTANRVELAKHLASVGAEDSIIQRVGRGGVSALSKAEQLQHGLRPTLLLAGTAIPGTQAIAATTRKVTDFLRMAAADTIVGRAARAVGTTAENRTATEAVVKGGERAATSAKDLLAEQEATALAKQFGNVQGRALHSILKDIPKDQFHTLAADIENGVTTGHAGKINDWLSNLQTEANARGANLGKLTNYYPHLITEDAKAALEKTGRRARGVASGPELARKLVAGQDFLGQTLESGTVDEINRIAKEKLGHEMFDVKTNKVLPAYLAAVTHAVKKGAYADKLVEQGVGRRVVPAAERFAKSAAEDVTARPMPGPTISATVAPPVTHQFVKTAEDKVAATSQELNDLIAKTEGRMPTSGAVPHLPDAASVETANLKATLDQGAHIADPSALAASVDNTAQAATVASAAGAAQGTAGRLVQDAKDLITKSTSDPDPQIRANATLEAAAKNAEARFALTGDDLTQEEMSTWLHSEQARTIVTDQVQRGFKSIAHDVQVPEWLAEARHVERALTPAGWKTFLDGYDRFTAFWKSGATMSPGFHVRNAYSHAFNNFVANVATSAYADEFRLAKLAAKDGLSSEADKAAWDFVEKAVSATGHPFSPEEIGMGFAAQGKKIIGAPGRASRATGTFVQDRLRGAMALDSFKAGDSLSTAISRIERFHFNYSNLSNFDRAAKRIIPFWMWTSRNLPLQLQMIIRRPAAYNKFMSLERNLSLGVPQDQVVPSYFGEVGSFPVDIPFPGGEGTKYAAPELGFLRAQDLLDQIQDPVRLLSNANPLIKLPIEHIAGKKLFNDVPFKPGYQDLPGALSLPGIKQALEVLGVAKQGAKGPMTTDEAMYALESLIPAEGRVRRLAPTEDQYTERWPTSIASFLGANSLTNTPAAQEGELYRRKRALDAFVKQQQALGYYPKAKSTAPKPKPFGK